MREVVLAELATMPDGPKTSKPYLSFGVRVTVLPFGIVFGNTIENLINVVPAYVLPLPAQYESFIVYVPGWY